MKVNRSRGTCLIVKNHAEEKSVSMEKLTLFSSQLCERKRDGGNL